MDFEQKKYLGGLGLSRNYIDYISTIIELNEIKKLGKSYFSEETSKKEGGLNDNGFESKSRDYYHDNAMMGLLLRYFGKKEEAEEIEKKQLEYIKSKS